MSDTPMKIFQQIPKVMGDLAPVGKRGVNEGQGGYKFRKIDDVYDSLHPALAKHGVFIVPKIIEHKEERFQTSKGSNQIRVTLKVEYRVFADDGSFLTTEIMGEGIDSSDKAIPKAMTAAFKYFLFEIFCIAVEGETDADRETPQGPQAKPSSTPAADPKVERSKKMIVALRSVGVSESMVRQRFNVEAKVALVLDDKQINELTDIGKKLKAGENSTADFFKVEPPQATEQKP